MSTLIKRLSQNGTQFVPITLSEAVVVNTTNTVLNQLGITTLDKVLRTTLGLIETNNSDLSTLQQTVDNINLVLSNKQNKLTPGNGITITEDGIISASIDTTLYKVVTSLPEASSDCENSIYLVLSVSGVSGNTFKEFICVNNGTAELPNYVWEELGTVQTDVDLSGYVTKEEFTTELNTIKETLNNTITAENVTTSTGSIIQVTYDIPNDLYDNAITDSTDYI